MELFIAFILGICLITGYVPVKSPPSGELILALSPDLPSRIRAKVTPVSVLQYQDIIKQTYDYSCGSAALSTLLRNYLGEDITEQQVIQGLLTYGDKNQIISRRAFSLLDMKKYVGVLGYEGAGYRAEIADLKDPANWPLILPVTLFEYRL